MRAVLAAAAAALLGCAPFYRVDELRGLSAVDGEERASVLAKARERMAGGDAAGAAEAFRQVLELDPSPSAELFLSLAQAQAAAGQRAPARAAARRGLSLRPSASSQAALRDLLVRLYAEDGLFEPALDFLPGQSLLAAMQVPALARVFGALADASELARAGQGQRALERYEDWLGGYGVPDHPALVAWSDAVLEAGADLAGQAAADADRAVAEGRLADAVRLFSLAFRFQTSAAFEGGTRLRFESACARAGDLTPLLPPEALARAREAGEALEENRLGDALSGYRRAVALAPWWGEAHHNLALLLARLEQYGSAAKQMRAFLRLSRDFAQSARAQSLISGWERRADPAQADSVRSEQDALESALTRNRASASAWRDRGWLLTSAGALAGAGAAACALLGSQTNQRVLGGDFDTGPDMLLAAETGRTYNALGTGFGIAAAALVMVGIPIVLFNGDPRPPSLSASVGPGYAGLVWSGALP